MNKSVPTLLGIVIILLVVVLVVLVYTYKMTQELSAGGQVVGTVGGEVLTGVEAPEEDIGTSEVLGAREPESQAEQLPGVSTRAGEKMEERSEGQQRESRQAERTAGE
ncbi:MAG: hypothetical protein JXA57_01525 [Armatimonadetes bacterium]|nr:hypothetical protein [Armatimonadota bacterium]